MQRVLKIMAWLGRYIGHWFSVETHNAQFHKILVFQAGGIGDIVRIFPVIASLKIQFPAAQIITLSPFSEIVYDLLPPDQRPDQRVSYEPLKQHRGLLAKLRLAFSLRRQGFDLIVNPARGEGMLEHAILSRLIGGRCCCIGFEKNGAGFLNTLKYPLQDDIPIVRQNLALLEMLGISPAQQHIRLIVPEADRRFAADLLQSYRATPEHQLIVIQAGNHWRQELRWPAKCYAQLLTRLSERVACTLVLIGAAAESELNQALLQQAPQAQAVDLAGKTTLMQLVALLQQADLFIGNDSGPLHLALACATPTVGIFGFTSPQQVIEPNGPCIALHKAEREQVFLHQPFQAFDPQQANPIERVSVDEVLQAALELLERR